MSNVFTKIGGLFKTVFVHIGHAFIALVGKDRAEAFGKAALDVLKTEAGKVVMAAVQAVESLAIAGTEKHSLAFDNIKKQFIASGISVKDSYINLLIELAVGVLKGTYAEVAK